MEIKNYFQIPPKKCFNNVSDNGHYWMGRSLGEMLMWTLRWMEKADTVLNKWMKEILTVLILIVSNYIFSTDYIHSYIPQVFLRALILCQVWYQALT